MKSTGNSQAQIPPKAKRIFSGKELSVRILCSTVFAHKLSYDIASQTAGTVANGLSDTFSNYHDYTVRSVLRRHIDEFM